MLVSLPMLLFLVVVDVHLLLACRGVTCRPIASSYTRPRLRGGIVGLGLQCILLLDVAATQLEALLNRYIHATSALVKTDPGR